jgi:DNA replicative helicase MCM subunit Mcm2 (Cdc46/Mcm family)
MVSLEGIVTKTSLVRPKVVKSVHYNENKQKFHFREYRDQTMTTGAASSSVYPTEDEEGNPVSIEFILAEQRLIDIAHHRIRLLCLQRSPGYLDPGDA